MRFVDPEKLVFLLLRLSESVGAVHESVQRLLVRLMRRYSPPEYPLCSLCFRNIGLRADASSIGISDPVECTNCGCIDGIKLDREAISRLAHMFFVRGSLVRCEYGAAPTIQFNEHQKTSIDRNLWIDEDLDLFEKAIGVGFFDYGPRMWMVGEVEPLLELQEVSTRKSVVERILNSYPVVTIRQDQSFYRVRANLSNSHDLVQYDAPPHRLAGSNRLDSLDFPVLYASTDLGICIHECRIAAEDEIFAATLRPTRDLKLLDLCELIEEDGTEFDSLDMAVHMLFLAGKHSYEICREIALAAHTAGFDGLIYPSYFSLLRTGAMPFETAYGISLRRMSHMREYERSKTIPNLALFGRPLESGAVKVDCINRVILHKVDYEVHFGPVMN